MNTLLKLVNGWSEKLTVNVLRLIGASSDTLEKVTNAFNARDTATSEDQAKIAAVNSPFPTIFKIIKYVIIAAALFLIGFFGFKFIKKHKLFKR